MVRTVLVLLVLTVCAGVSAETVSVEPTESFSDIDVATDQRIAKRLMKGRKSAIEAVLENPDSYSPPALYALSKALLKKRRMEEAMFWFYLGQLRARSDANKSLDISARQAVAVLNQQFGPNINEVAFQDIELLKAVISEVADWDTQHSREYDARWIALHGMDAFTQSDIAFESPEKWDAIDARTRTEYLSGFNSLMQQLNE